MTDVDATAAIGARVDALGGTWMGRPLMAIGAELGFDGYPWPFYMVGRAGVLGDVSADEVYDAMVFPSPRLVRSAWHAGRERLVLDEGVELFIGCTYQWAPGALPAGADLDRTTDLLERLATSVDCTPAPLAEGWRRVPRPSGVAERSVWAIHVLREQRGGIHAAALLEAGVSPLEGIMATEGEMMAEMYGWERPYPDPEASRTRKRPVEAATNNAVGRTYGALDDASLLELADLLGRFVPAP